MGGDAARPWNGRGHFFAAAAEAMRRILVERRPPRRPRSAAAGARRPADFETWPATAVTPDQLLALDDALDRLAALDPLAGELVKLRYFAGLGLDQAAAAVGVSTATAYRRWAYARAWLQQRAVEGFVST